MALLGGVFNLIVICAAISGVACAENHVTQTQTPEQNALPPLLSELLAWILAFAMVIANIIVGLIINKMKNQQIESVTNSAKDTKVAQDERIKSIERELKTEKSAFKRMEKQKDSHIQQLKEHADHWEKLTSQDVLELAKGIRDRSAADKEILVDEQKEVAALKEQAEHALQEAEKHRASAQVVLASAEDEAKRKVKQGQEREAKLKKTIQTLEAKRNFLDFQICEKEKQVESWGKISDDITTASGFVFRQGYWQPDDTTPAHMKPTGFPGAQGVSVGSLYTTPKTKTIRELLSDDPEDEDEPELGKPTGFGIDHEDTADSVYKTNPNYKRLTIKQKGCDDPKNADDK